LNFYPRCLCSTFALKVVPDFFLSDKMAESRTIYGSGYRMIFNLRVESFLNYLQFPYYSVGNSICLPSQNSNRYCISPPYIATDLEAIPSTFVPGSVEHCGSQPYLAEHISIWSTSFPHPSLKLIGTMDSSKLYQNVRFYRAKFWTLCPESINVTGRPCRGLSAFYTTCIPTLAQLDLEFVFGFLSIPPLYTVKNLCVSYLAQHPHFKNFCLDR